MTAPTRKLFRKQGTSPPKRFGAVKSAPASFAPTRLPKGSGELGFLGVALLIVLFVATSAIAPNEQGIRIDRLGHSIERKDGVEWMTIHLDERGYVRDGERFLAIEAYVREKTKEPVFFNAPVYLITTTRSTPFGNVVVLRDRLVAMGIGEEKIVWGSYWD